MVGYQVSRSQHKKNDVLEINIEGVITSCIVIEDLKTFTTTDDLLGQYILYDLDYSHDNWLAFDSSELTKMKYHICKIEDRRTTKGFTAAYRLLIGDKRVWFTYDCYDTTESHKKNL